MDFDEKKDLRDLMEELSAATKPMKAAIERESTVGEMTQTVRIEVDSRELEGDQ